MALGLAVEFGEPRVHPANVSKATMASAAIRATIATESNWGGKWGYRAVDQPIADEAELLSALVSSRVREPALDAVAASVGEGRPRVGPKDVRREGQPDKHGEYQDQLHAASLRRPTIS